jgi:hypothetical protein
MPIVWNDKARAQILPRTREQAGDFKPGNRGKIWAAIQKTFALRGKYDPIDGTFVKGQTLATPQLAALMDKCVPIAKCEDVPTIDDIDVAGAFVALASKHAYTQLTSFCSRRCPCRARSTRSSARATSPSRRTT